jgi:hypothetical protein
MTDHDNAQKSQAGPGLGTEAELTDMIQHNSARTAPLAGVIRAEETAVDERGTWQIEQGIDVLCRDGDKVGEVVEVRSGHLVVEEGFFDPQDLYIPIDLIEDHDETSLALSITRDTFEASDWTEEPDADDELDDEAEDADDAP